MLICGVRARATSILASLVALLSIVGCEHLPEVPLTWSHDEAVESPSLPTPIDADLTLRVAIVDGFTSLADLEVEATLSNEGDHSRSVCMSELAAEKQFLELELRDDSGDLVGPVKKIHSLVLLTSEEDLARIIHEPSS